MRRAFKRADDIRLLRARLFISDRSLSNARRAWFSPQGSPSGIWVARSEHGCEGRSSGLTISAYFVRGSLFQIGAYRTRGGLGSAHRVAHPESGWHALSMDAKGVQAG